jgi:hypothetical protein
MQDEGYRISLRAKDGSVRAWAIVDAADGERVRNIKWHLTPNGYVMGHIPLSKPKRKDTLHRFLLRLDVGDGLHVDHIDRDRLNNRRSNLRIVTQAQNNQNTSGWARSSSSYRGVQRSRAGRWIASATVDYKPFHLGTFDDELEAARVAAAFRAKHMPHSAEAA